MILFRISYFSGKDKIVEIVTGGMKAMVDVPPVPPPALPDDNTRVASECVMRAVAPLVRLLGSASPTNAGEAAGTRARETCAGIRVP